MSVTAQPLHVKNVHKEEDQVEIIYYTDPLCCWSWAFEPQWQKLRDEYQGNIFWSYRMGGLIADWSNFSDPFNSISRPIHMGPIWLEAQQLSGMPMQSKVWLEDPPHSSYPACIAVKCAELQSAEAAEAMLRSLREAIMLDGKNIARRKVLLEVAEKLSAAKPELFSAAQFEQELDKNAALEAFRSDLKQVRYHQIGRFPTLTLQKPGKPGVIIIGFRPYNLLVTALEQVAPGIKPIRHYTIEKSAQYT